MEWCTPKRLDPGMISTRCILLLSSLLALRASAFGEAPKYLIVTAPSRSTIAYVKLPASGAPPTPGEPMRTLIDKGIQVPQGIAVDEYRNRLYVADPNLGKLVAYDLRPRADELSVGKQWTVAAGVEVRSVTLDGLGNVYFTEEPTQRIMKVTAQMIERGEQTPIVLYDGGSVSEVSAPGGIASDNYFVYWLNKASGQQVGSVVRGGVEAGTGAAAPVGLASNAMKCYGICIALGNVFYSDETKNLYGLNRASTVKHDPVAISTTFQEPRGCAFDGDGTVYVADKVANSISAFPSNMKNLTIMPMTKAADLEGAFGVAIYNAIKD